MCPKADDLYDVYKNSVTAWAYKNFQIPLFFARGLGPSLLPRPITLKHFLSEPIMPPKLKAYSGLKFEQAVDEFHKQLVLQSRGLISQAINDRT